MTILPKRLFDPVQLTASAVTYYTAPTNTRCILKKVTVTNPTSSAAARLVTVHIIPLGGSASDSNMIVSAKPVAVGQSMDLFEVENHILNPGDFIQALADSASDVTFMGSGLEVT